jgi:hypothetical protein
MESARLTGVSPLSVLAQALGVAYAAGINVPATVAILGLAQRQGWIGHLPAGLDVVANPWIIGLALAIYAVEFLVRWSRVATSQGDNSDIRQANSCGGSGCGGGFHPQQCLRCRRPSGGQPCCDHARHEARSARYAVDAHRSRSPTPREHRGAGNGASCQWRCGIIPISRSRWLWHCWWC